MNINLMNGDNLELLKKLPDNSVDSIVTDPPYGLSFMNKKWDYDVPSVELWKEVYRVLKPGGHVLSFGGTRTYHRMVVNIEDAGFEIRDQIMWLYGSGFPKSHNISKAVDKLQGNERVECIDEKKYEGWGTALKPANEPICVARKPLSEKTVALNVLKWGTGGINIDGCRVGYTSEVDKENTINAKYTTDKDNKQSEDWGTKQIGNVSKEEGRFPANIILECICDEVIKGEKGEIKSIIGKVKNNGEVYGGGKGKNTSDYISYCISGDKGDIHTNPMCPCRLIDEQSGGASRFFYQAKVSKKERNMGLDGFEEKESQQKGHGLDRICMNEGCGISMLKPELCKCDEPDWRPKKNIHPTVKPVNLMVYLCRLVTPQGGTILDPYMGSGSTGISALLEGFNFIGMDLDPEYIKISEARISNYEKYREFHNPNKGLVNGNKRMASRSDDSNSLGLGICKKKKINK